MSTSLTDAVASQEQTLLRELSAGAAVSAGVGAGLWAWGAAQHRPAATAFGRQTLAWALIDGLIALVGRRGATSSPPDRTAALARARRMRTVLTVNAALDVGYVAAGLALTRWERAPRATRVADGTAVVIQGAFLLWLDVRHARRFQRLARSAA